MFTRLIAIFAFLVVASAAQGQTIPWSAVGTTCVPNGATVGHYQTTATVGGVRHLGAETGTLVFTCTVQPFTTAITAWVLKLNYRDSTGMAASASVVARLYRMPFADSTPVLVETLSSNSFAATALTSKSSIASFNHTFNFTNNVYFVQVTMARNGAQVVQFHSVAIEEK